MGFSIRDERPVSALALLSGQRGQGIVEYILVLVVTVALVLTGLYQLNSAFKSWANNYFGNYLACLLETGELPTISGGGGDRGLCNEVFKPFSLAEGRPLVGNWSPGEGSAPGRGRGSREANRGGSTVGGGGGGYGGRTGRFSSRGGGLSRSTIKASGKKGSGATYTGSTGTTDYGGGYGSTNRRLNVGVRQRLDNKFAFEEERERKDSRKMASTTRRPGDESAKAPRIRVKRSEIKKVDTEVADSGLNLPNFLRILIIAGIVIALVMFLGGQALQIGKSMD